MNDSNLTVKKFSETIEHIVSQNNITYIDAITEYCERYEIEIETAASMCNMKIKQMLESEASDLNMLKEKISRLPV